MTSMSSGCLLEPATGFADSSTIMASSLGLVCTFAVSDNWSSKVYCSNVPCDGTVVDFTVLMERGGGHETCLTAAHLAASFHILPDMAFSDHHLVNSSITSVMHSVRGKPSILAEPMEDFFILLCPFVPFGTCGWGSQPHTAIIAVWQFILIVRQYIICSRSTERFTESDFEGMSHAFWCYLSVPQPEIYV